MKEEPLKRYEVDFIPGYIRFSEGSSVFLDTGEGEDLLEIHDGDILDVIYESSGDWSGLVENLSKDQVIKHKRHFNKNNLCRLYPGENRRLVVYDPGTTSLFGHKDGDKITVFFKPVYSDLTEDDYLYGSLIKISDDHKGFVFKEHETGAIRHFAFSEVHYVGKGHKKYSV